MKEKIMTALAPTPTGSFSQGIKAGHRIYVSGQTPYNAQTGEMPKTIEEQTRQVLSNIKYVLEEAGATLDDVVKVNTHLVNLEEFDVYDKVYREFFNEPLPARTTDGSLLKGIPIEMDVIAEIE